MKFMCACDECMHSHARATLLFISYQENGLYDLTCDYGHRRLLVLQEHPFEVLYEIASNAIIDGYYREAVTSFAASLERFYEFTIRVLLRARGFDHAQIDATWTAISDKSERQAGAFVALWAAHFGEPPMILTGTKQKFRNDVVHKGVIPTRDKAIEFGQAVLELIRQQSALLRERCKTEIDDVVIKRNGDLMRSAGSCAQVSVAVATSAVGIHNNSADKPSLAEIIEKMQDKRRTIEQMMVAFKMQRDSLG
jgi:hypothetical protein